MKVDGWQSRLFATIEAARDKPFAWGKNDCVSFAADCVDAQTYSTFRQLTDVTFPRTDARTALKHYQDGGLRALVTDELGPAVPWGRCGQGDVVLAGFEGREFLTVHDGVQLVGVWEVGVSEAGLLLLPLIAAECGWRVT